jgi:hypothetical protein
MAHSSPRSSAGRTPTLITPVSSRLRFLVHPIRMAEVVVRERRYNIEAVREQMAEGGEE